ncbi:hypothetical protein Q8F55_001775 [Vanrija albida]|uniref:Leucine-rich repeat-containing N-terminal plant-type domain-containing protein n=1 Tax=Vanrija albida TaxID=181172 RepID=A0ABR3Q862_9TREE
MPDPARFKTRFSHLSFLHGFPANARAPDADEPPTPTTMRSVSGGTARPAKVARHESHRAEVLPPRHPFARDSNYPIDIDEWARSPGPTSPPRRKPSGPRRPPPPPLNLELSRAPPVRADRGPLQLEREELASPPLEVARRVPLAPAADDDAVHVKAEHAYPAAAHAPDTPPQPWSALEPARFRRAPSPANGPPRRPAPASPLELHDVVLTPALRPPTHVSAASREHNGALKALGAAVAGTRVSRALDRSVRFGPAHHRLSSDAGDGDLGWAETAAAGGGKRQPKPRHAKWRKYRCALVVLALIVLGTGILAAVLATQRSTSPDAAPAKGGAGAATPSSSPAGSATRPTSAPTPSATDPAAAAACLAQFGKLTAAAYPCAACAPALSALPNDFLSPTPAANSTGAALQLCALRDVLDAIAPGANNTLKAAGWGGSAPLCSWDRLKCDARGRVTELWLYTTDPVAALPASLGNLVALTSLKVFGNASLPAGPFPSSVFALPNLTDIRIQNTAVVGSLTGPAPAVQSLRLIANPGLGNAVPDLSKFTSLKTLVINYQNLSRPFNASIFPPSLNFLDLSYNAFSGTMPDLSRITSLANIYFQANDLTGFPPAFPAGLATINLTNNTHLSGTRPKALCGAQLASCDLRNTAFGSALAAANVSCGTCLLKVD